MIRYFSNILFFSICVTGLCSTSLAQDSDPERGRLADGRAFRTDTDGSQLIDYIAELEQSLTEQNRKIISLEDENLNLKAEVTRVKAGRSDKIKEKDIFAGSKQAVEELEPKCPELVCPEVAECPEITQNVACSECPKIENAVCPQPEVQVVENKEDLEKQKILRAEIAKLEQLLAKSREERDHFSAIAQQATNEAKKQIERAKQQEMRASMNPELEVSRLHATDAVKSRMRKEIQLLINRKDERDILFAKHVKDRPGIKLSPSSLRSKSGRDLKQLEVLVAKAETMRELSTLKVDLEEIRRQMLDDLALIERMSKLN